MRIDPRRVFYAIPSVKPVGRERPRERGDRRAPEPEAEPSELGREAEGEDEAVGEEEGGRRHIDVRV